jgi:hypothetical protein
VSKKSSPGKKRNNFGVRRISFFDFPDFLKKPADLNARKVAAKVASLGIGSQLIRVISPLISFAIVLGMVFVVIAAYNATAFSYYLVRTPLKGAYGTDASVYLDKYTGLFSSVSTTLNGQMLIKTPDDSPSVRDSSDNFGMQELTMDVDPGATVFKFSGSAISRYSREHPWALKDSKSDCLSVRDLTPLNSSSLQSKGISGSVIGAEYTMVTTCELKKAEVIGAVFGNNPGTAAKILDAYIGYAALGMIDHASHGYASVGSALLPSGPGRLSLYVADVFSPLVLLGMERSTHYMDKTTDSEVIEPGKYVHVKFFKNEIDVSFDK